MTSPIDLVASGLGWRNRVSRDFFAREADRLAHACREMAARFSRGGRLLAFGSGSAITDAQHVAVEFVHPVIVGKRALPALDVSAASCGSLSALVGSDDIVMGFAAAPGDPAFDRALQMAAARGAQTFALPGRGATYAIDTIDGDPFVHQEIVEMLYHVLWETVHVFLEHAPLGHDAGQASFLYPFLGSDNQITDGLVEQVARSIRSKAQDDERLREDVASRSSQTIVAAARAIHERIADGGTLLLFGNGGSATDANDWALDCVLSPKGYRPIRAISLSMESASLSAIANDIGREAMFLRQLMAHARPRDVAVAISTSGGSANIMTALVEARRQGLLTIALAGYDGGEIVQRGLADFAIVVHGDYIPRIQEVQASIYHIMIDLLNAAGAGQT
jgi:D-sedoheptulose 7-phosphate isomerase